MKTNWVYWYQQIEDGKIANLTTFWNNLENDPIAKDYIVGTITDGNREEVQKFGYNLSNFVGATISENGNAIKFEWELV